MVSDEHYLVLLLTDNEDSATIISNNFNALDSMHVVHKLQDSKLAVDYLQQCLNKTDPDRYIKPRLIVLDIHALGDGVVALLEFLQQHQELKRIPVLLLSKSRDKGEIQKAYSLKVNSYLIKPDDKKELADMVKEVASYWLKWNHLPP